MVVQLSVNILISASLPLRIWTLSSNLGKRPWQFQCGLVIGPTLGQAQSGYIYMVHPSGIVRRRHSSWIPLERSNEERRHWMKSHLFQIEIILRIHLIKDLLYLFFQVWGLGLLEFVLINFFCLLGACIWSSNKRLFVFLLKSDGPLLLSTKKQIQIVLLPTKFYSNLVDRVHQWAKHLGHYTTTFHLRTQPLLRSDSKSISFLPIKLLRCHLQ